MTVEKLRLHTVTDYAQRVRFCCRTTTCIHQDSTTEYWTGRR
jgi:hypothetical protein